MRLFLAALAALANSLRRSVRRGVQQGLDMGEGRDRGVAFLRRPVRADRAWENQVSSWVGEGWRGAGGTCQLVRVSSRGAQSMSPPFGGRWRCVP